MLVTLCWTPQKKHGEIDPPKKKDTKNGGVSFWVPEPKTFSQKQDRDFLYGNP